MPFTPFHFGPGGIIHAMVPRRVSFLSFCAANVLIDVEPLYYILSGRYPLHRFFHTYVGATLITAVTIVLFMTILKVSASVRLPNLFDWQELKIGQIGLGAAAGAYSHIVLDSIMHSDIRPFSPFSEANSLYQSLSLGALHGFCLLSGVVALVWVAARRRLRGRGAG